MLSRRRAAGGRPRLRAVRTAIAASISAALLAAPAARADASPWLFTFENHVPKSADDVTPDSAYFYLPQAPPGSSAARPVARLVRGSAVLAEEDTGYDRDWYGTVPVAGLQAGDVLEARDASTGQIYAAATYSGRPAFDAEACAGRTYVDGLRSPGAAIEDLGAYGNQGWADPADSSSLDGRVTELTGEVFGGVMTGPLVLGSYVWAREAVLPTGDGPEVDSYGEQLVGVCPPPAAPTAPLQDATTLPATFAPVPTPGVTAVSRPAVDRTAPTGTLTAPRRRAAIDARALRKAGASFVVSSDEAATARATLYLEPRRGSARPLVIGARSAVVRAGGRVRVTARLSAAGRRALAKRSLTSGARLKAVVTLTDAAGNVATLPAAWLASPRR